MATNQENVDRHIAAGEAALADAEKKGKTSGQVDALSMLAHVHLDFARHYQDEDAHNE